MEGTVVVNPMLEAITSALATVLDWFGTVITSLVTTDGDLNALLPIFAVGICVSLVMIGVKVVRRIAWGA